ncbi:RHS Repeat protein [compost metagenome]
MDNLTRRFSYNVGGHLTRLDEIGYGENAERPERHTLFERDAIGRLVAKINRDASQTFAYDDGDRLLSIERQPTGIGKQLGIAEEKLEYTYETCTARCTAPKASSPVALATTRWGARPGSLRRPCRPTNSRRCITPVSIPRCWWSMPITRFIAVISTTRRENWCERSTSCVERPNTSTRPMVSCAAAIPAR